MNLSNRIRTFGSIGFYNFDIHAPITRPPCPSKNRCSGIGSDNCISGYRSWYYNTTLDTSKKLLYKKKELFTDNSSYETWHNNNINILQNQMHLHYNQLCDNQKDRLNYFNGSLSDRVIEKKNKNVNVPSHGNSKHTSKTNHRPGASTPNTRGVDIKHSSYNRYLLKKKAKLQNQQLGKHQTLIQQNNICFNMK
jgi:viroplasmin and RNaseH domain-containing protein